jgi:L,D-peptidoglycan transpeptidase YkuD (ErfK/YbiS/YcfS/YnhG family)
MTLPRRRAGRLLALALLTGLLGGMFVTAGPASLARADSVTLGGVRVRVTDQTGQAVVVNRTSGYRATVTWWVRTGDGWVQRMRARDGRIGYGGLVRPHRRKQGTGTTPLGTHRLLSAFGTHARDDAWQLSYRRIRKGDYWVQDNRSAYYNRYRNKAQGGFRWWLSASNPNSSERLRDYRRQYEWSIVTSFNHAQVRHRGAGIFLHVNGSGATAGCVSAPRRFIRSLMSRLNAAKRPVIAVGR